MSLARTRVFSLSGMSILTGLVIASLWILTRMAGPSVRVIEENSPAPLSTLTVRPGSSIRQTFGRGHLPSTIALRLSPGRAVPSVAARLLDGETVLVEGSLTRGNLPDGSLRGEGEWLIVSLSGLVSSTANGDRVLEVSVASDASGALVLRFQHDDAKFSAGSVTIDHRPHAGDLAFILYRPATFTERLSEQLLTRGRLWEPVWILLCTLVLAWSLDIIRRFRAGLAIIPDRPVLLYAILALLFSFPFFSAGTNWGVWDWPEVMAHMASARHSIAAGQFPLWNPYFCGGNPLWGNPQAYWPSLTFLSVLLIGPIIGSVVAILMMVFLGLLGMHALARHLGISREGAFISAIILLCSGFLASHLAAGQLLWLTIAWLPWAIVWFLRSFTRPWAIVPSVLFFLLIFLEGRVHLVVYGGILLAILSLGVAIRERLLSRWARQLAVFCILAGLLGAVKLFPTFAFLRALSGTLPNTDGTPLRGIIDVFFARSVLLDAHPAWATLSWHEYAAYVGIGAVLLAVCGIAYLWRRERSIGTVFLVIGLFFGLLMTSSAERNLFEWVPVLFELRNPGRAVSMVILVLALCAGWAPMLLPSAKRWARLIPLLTVCAALLLFADFSNVAHPAFSRVFSAAPQTFNGNGASFYQSEGYYSSGYHVVRAGYGARDYCPPHLQLFGRDARVRAKQESVYRGEVERESGGEAVLTSFTPNRLTVHVGAHEESDILVLNQHFDSGWTSAGYTVQKHTDGRVAVVLKPNAPETDIILRYLPFTFLLGMTVSLLTAGLLTAFWYRSRHRKTTR